MDTLSVFLMRICDLGQHASRYAGNKESLSSAQSNVGSRCIAAGQAQNPGFARVSGGSGLTGG